MCPSDRRGIANGTVGDKNENWKKLSPDQQNEIKAHGNVQHWSLAIETADTGTKHDPDISAFTPIQAEVVAQIIAFESIVHGFPISTPSTWHDAGVAADTDPSDFPFWTLFRGKICPGDKKKAQLRDVVMPRARDIRDAWTSGKTTEDPVPVTDDPAPASTVVRAGEGWMAIARRTIGETRGKRSVTSTEVRIVCSSPETRSPFLSEAARQGVDLVTQVLGGFMWWPRQAR